MSGQLNSFGIISHFAGLVGERLVAANLSWPAAFCLLNGVYFVLHYAFASQTAHVGALYIAFLGMMKVAGVPLHLGALALGFMSNLFGGITHYGSGQGAVYYGTGAWRAMALLVWTGWETDARVFSGREVWAWPAAAAAQLHTPGSCPPKPHPPMQATWSSRRCSSTVGSWPWCRC